jgi:opacity protein-like surface antigen
MKSGSSLVGVASAVVILGTQAAFAQDHDWDYKATIYLFMPETVTTIGSIETKLSFSDALDNLDFAFMGAFEANNGRWGFIADYMYTDLTFNGDTLGPVFSGADTSVTLKVFNGYATYRVLETSDVKVDLLGGFRWFGVDSEITLVGGPGPGPAPSASADADWIDPVIGARSRFRLSDRWFGTAAFDYGGFSSDSETWQALLTAGYEINENWTVQGGYRYLEVDHDMNGTDFNLSQSGLLLGTSYRF